MDGCETGLKKIIGFVPPILFASAGNGVVFELKLNPSPMQQELVTVPVQQRDGCGEVATGPGQRIAIDGDVVKRQLIRWIWLSPCQLCWARRPFALTLCIG